MLSKSMSTEKSNPTSFIKGTQVSDLESCQEKPRFTKSLPSRAIFSNLIPGKGSHTRTIFSIKRLALALVFVHSTGPLLD